MAAPRIVLIATGGTIASTGEEGGARVSLSPEGLLARVPGLPGDVSVEAVAFSHLPGSHLALETVLALARRVEEELERASGVVVTHGTDTLEETAYLLWLTLRSDKPVAVTGSMRIASQAGYDGPRNLLDAVRTAASEKARGLGPVVVFGEEVHSARWATKVHSQKPAAFASPPTGPLGYVDAEGLHLYTRPAIPRRPLEKAARGPVEILHLALDPDPGPLRRALDAGVRGIVLAAFGSGRVHPRLLPLVEEAVGGGVPVVVTTRCPAGRLGDPYGYPGAAQDLLRAGAVFAHDLSPQKARLELMVALASLSTPDAVREHFRSAAS